MSLSNIDKSIKVMTNKIDDKLSPWKIPLFIFIPHSVSLLHVNFTFWVFIAFSITFFILLATLRILRHCRIHVWGTIGFPFYLKLAVLWFPYSVFWSPSLHQATLSLFPCENLPHDWKAHNQPKIWSKFLFVF